MPIRIDKIEGKSRNTISHLCDDEWEMPIQIQTLQSWLIENSSKLQPGEYVADLGYSPRPNAAGGGCNLSPQSMLLMSNIGMSLELSEYPAFVEQ